MRQPAVLQRGRSAAGLRRAERPQNLFVIGGSSPLLVDPSPIAGGTPQQATFDGASSDLSTVVFDEQAQLTADAPGPPEGGSQPDVLYASTPSATANPTVKLATAPTRRDSSRWDVGRRRRVEPRRISGRRLRRDLGRRLEDLLHRDPDREQHDKPVRPREPDAARRRAPLRWTPESAVAGSSSPPRRMARTSTSWTAPGTISTTTTPRPITSPT